MPKQRSEVIRSKGAFLSDFSHRVVDLVQTIGLLCDLLWSDPDKDIRGWGENDRGVSFTFGADIVARFLSRFDLDLVTRAHQVRPSYSTDSTDSTYSTHSTRSTFTMARRDCTQNPLT